MKIKDCYIKYSYYSLILILLSLTVLKKIYDYDIWYHLVIGREVFQTLHVPAMEFFVYTQQGEPVSFHEWGFGLFFYLAYRWFGYFGMGVANALLGSITLFFFYLSTEKERINYLAAILLVPLFWLVDFRLMYRPEMFFFLFLGMEIYLLEKFSDKADWRWLYLLPLLTFLLNLFHPSALFLLIVFAAYSLQFIFDAYRQRTFCSVFFWKLVAVFVAAFLTSAVNPYGFQQTFIPVSFVQSAEYLKRVVEFNPTFETSLKPQYIVIAVSGLLALLFQPKRRIVDWLLFIFFGYLGFRYVRNVALFAFITYLPAARTISSLAGRLPFMRSSMGERVAGACVVIAMLSSLIVIAERPTWGVAPFPGRFPDGASKIISDMRPAGRIFNAYSMGGYFAWRLYDKYLVNIDGRHYSMDKSFILEDQVFQAKPGWQKVLAGYKVSMIFTPATSPFTGVLVQLLPYLDTDEGWILVSAEPSGLLFMRREVLPMMQGWQMPDQNQTWWQVINEAGVIPVSPGHADAYLSMSIAYFRLHKLKESIFYMKKYAELTPDDTEAAKNLAILETGGTFDTAAAPPSSKFRMF